VPRDLLVQTAAGFDEVYVTQTTVLRNAHIETGDDRDIVHLGEQAMGSNGLEVTFRDTFELGSSTTDQNAQTFTVTGLSGITHRGGESYTAVMDNSNKLVNLSIALGADGTIEDAAINGGLSLDETHDHEGIAFTNATRNSVFVSDEDVPAGVREYSLDNGAILQTVDVPAVFDNRVFNRGLESFTRRADGLQMWTANEEALSVDGPLATDTAGTVVRLLEYIVSGNTVTPGAQFAYVVDPVHGPGAMGQSGLSDLVVLDDGTLLALERSGQVGLPVFRSRIYEIDFTDATRIDAAPFDDGLIGETFTPVTKRLLWESTELNQNLEGLTLGPMLTNGNWSLLGITDDGDPLSTNALVSFELFDAGPAPEPDNGFDTTIHGNLCIDTGNIVTYLNGDDGYIELGDSVVLDAVKVMKDTKIKTGNGHDDVTIVASAFGTSYKSNSSTWKQYCRPIRYCPYGNLRIYTGDGEDVIRVGEQWVNDTGVNAANASDDHQLVKVYGSLHINSGDARRHVPSDSEIAAAEYDETQNGETLPGTDTVLLYGVRVYKNAEICTGDGDDEVVVQQVTVGVEQCASKCEPKHSRPQRTHKAVYGTLMCPTSNGDDYSKREAKYGREHKKHRASYDYIYEASEKQACRAAHRAEKLARRYGMFRDKTPDCQPPANDCRIDYVPKHRPKYCAFGNVSIRTGYGDDSVHIGESNIVPLDATTENGHTDVSVRVFGNLIVRTGSGEDTLDVHHVKVGGTACLDTGSDPDTMTIDYLCACRIYATLGAGDEEIMTVSNSKAAWAKLSGGLGELEVLVEIDNEFEHLETSGFGAEE
jgi:hypothetical protein